eukprot:1483830-Amphidinium_carterae.1
MSMVWKVYALFTILDVAIHSTDHNCEQNTQCCSGAIAGQRKRLSLLGWYHTRGRRLRHLSFVLFTHGRPFPLAATATSHCDLLCLRKALNSSQTSEQTQPPC